MLAFRLPGKSFSGEGSSFWGDYPGMAVEQVESVKKRPREECVSLAWVVDPYILFSVVVARW